MKCKSLPDVYGVLFPCHFCLWHA